MGVEYASFIVPMSVLDAPCLTKKSFTTIENKLDNDHGLFLKKQAGAIERAIIVSNRGYHQGVTAITVIEGGWSKCSQNIHIMRNLGLALYLEKTILTIFRSKE